jgi:hypothetical protein
METFLILRYRWLRNRHSVRGFRHRIEGVSSFDESIAPVKMERRWTKR